MKHPFLQGFILIAFASSISLANPTAQAVLPSIIEAPPELLNEEPENKDPKRGELEHTDALESRTPQTLQMETFESDRTAEPLAELESATVEAENTPPFTEAFAAPAYEAWVESEDTPPQVEGPTQEGFKEPKKVEEIEAEVIPEPKALQENQKITESDILNENLGNLDVLESLENLEGENQTPSDELIQALSSSIKEEEKDSNDKILASLNPTLQQELKDLTEGLHREHRAIFNELRDDEELAISDLSMLWQAAVERSGAIRFAIEKLSRRNATGQPVNQVSFTKRLIQNVTQLTGTAASIWTGTPAGVLGGGLVQDLMNSDPSVSAMSRVTDADMLILAKEVEGLQSKVIESYYHYRHAEVQWKLARESKQNLGKYYAEQYASSSEDSLADSYQSLQPILDALYNGILLQEENAQRHYISSREHLGILVGAEAIIALEQTRTESAQR